MPKKRVDPLLKARAIDMIRAGRKIEEIRAALGVNDSTLRTWTKAYGPSSTPPRPSEADLSSASERIRVQAVPAPEGGGEPPRGGGGYNAARAAFEGGGEKPEAAPASGVDPVLALIMTSELALSVSCRFYALRLKVKWTDELQRMSRLTPEEKATLAAYGPFVAPFLSDLLLKYGKYIGPVIYGLAFYNMVLGRFASIKDMAPPPPPQSTAPDGAPPATPEQMAGA